MGDEAVLGRIESLVEEEHALLRREEDDAYDEEALAADRERRKEVSGQLDQCWQVLRQRRAQRAAGGDPG